jgi:hypothetical protein
MIRNFVTSARQLYRCAWDLRKKLADIDDEEQRRAILHSACFEKPPRHSTTSTVSSGDSRLQTAQREALSVERRRLERAAQHCSERQSNLEEATRRLAAEGAAAKREVAALLAERGVGLLAPVRTRVIQEELLEREEELSRTKSSLEKTEREKADLRLQQQHHPHHAADNIIRM